jgi:phosphate acetyltransferase
LSREVAHFKVAAMELPHFLDHVEDGSLIITPGDRADIILGSLMADTSAGYPQIAGVLLTGGLRPAPQILKLIEGLARANMPLLLTAGDTFSTAVAAGAVESRLAPGNPRKIAAALGLMEGLPVDRQALTGRADAAEPHRITPLRFEYELIQRAKQARQHIVLPEGTEERILRAAEILLLRDVVDITLLGDPDLIRRIAGELGLRLDGARIVDPTRSELRERYADALHQLRQHKGITRQMAWDMVEDVSYFGTLMVQCGDADGMVSGAVHTTQHTIRPAFQVIRTRPGHSLISSVFLMSLPDQVVVYGDCAVNPDPSAEELAEIAITSAATAARFGIEPRVAMLSYSTGDSGSGSSVDKVREAAAIARRLAPDLKLEGPIQYDAAVDSQVARTKLPDSQVAGRATVFVFPDLNTGNNTYKAVQRTAGAVAIGPILQGLNKPVNDLSRGCTVTDIVNTVAITAIQAQEKA